MDEHAPPPTAADLGISDGEYERIMRDLQKRQGIADPPERRSVPRWPFVLAGLVVGTLLLPRLVSAAPHDQEPEYAFLQMVGDQPVTYSSCRPIQVAVYPAGGPPDAEELVNDAVAQMRAATGLDIVVVGAFGGHAPNWNFEAAPITPEDPISVSWQDGDAIAQMTDDVAGLGGSHSMTTAYGGERRVAGTIALSRHYYALWHQQGDHAEELAVLLHEFGHVLGLAHVDSPGELMSEENVGRKTLGPGDREGLRLLGQGPCT